MGYYQGDFYQGDFYRGTRGDPGFFSFLGGLAKTAAGFIPGVGSVASTALAKIIPGGGGALARSGIGTMAKAGLGKMAASKLGRAVIKHPVLSAAGAAGAVGLGAGALAGRMGRHAVSGRRRRRMNPCNIHALRRSIRRAHSFSRIARKVLRFTSPRPPKGRMTFRVHRKKRTV